jgi:hypothetical protein
MKYVLGAGVCAIVAACATEPIMEPSESAGAPGHSGTGGSGAHAGGGRAGRGTAGGIAGRGGCGVAGSAARGGGCNVAGAAGRGSAGGLAMGGESGAGAPGEVDGGADQGGAGHGGAGEPGGAAGMAGAAGETNPHKLSDGVCPDPAPWSPGVERCGQSSFIHRTEALGCPLPERDPDDLPSDAGVDDLLGIPPCNQDKDCGSEGYCVDEIDSIDLEQTHVCVTPCASDSDCGADEACLCQPRLHNVKDEVVNLGVCKPAACSTDSDCGATAFCRSPLHPGCVNGLPIPVRLRCQSSGDECSGPDECPPAPSTDSAPVCSSRSGPFVCSIAEEC